MHLRGLVLQVAAALRGCRKKELEFLTSGFRDLDLWLYEGCGCGGFGDD